MEIKLTVENYNEMVQNYDGDCLIDFYATWCGPCKMISPIVSEIAEEGKIRVCKVDVDQEPALASAFSVNSIPTLVAFKKGKLVGKLIGYHEKEDLLQLFK